MLKLKKPELLSSRKSPKMRPGVEKETDIKFMDEIKIKKKIAEDLKITNNVNKYMINALQKDLGKLDDFEKTYILNKDGNRKILKTWGKDLAFSCVNTKK